LSKSIILLTVMAIGLTLTGAPCIAANAAHCRNYPNRAVSQTPSCFYDADWHWNANWSRLCDWCLGAPLRHARAKACFRNLTLHESKLLLYGSYYAQQDF
jgi:hypothetical protein